MVFGLPTKVSALDSCVILRVLENDAPEQTKKAVDLFLNGGDFYVSEAAKLVE